MANNDPDPKKLQDLERRLREARKSRGEYDRPTESPPSNLGIAFRLSTELVAAVVVGGAIGWALDKVLGTSPLLLIVMFFFGVAAGFFNVVRAARELNKNAER